MELRHLRSFVVVAEELHFGRAARRLHISQPPLSQHIAALEREVGVLLLRRTSRRVELTEAGQRFLEGARQTLATARQAQELARRAKTGHIGWLHIGFVPAYAMVPRVIRRYVRRFPDVQLTLRCMPSVDQLACVQDGRLDLGFVHLPIDVPELQCEKVQESTVVVALPTGHRLADQARVAWESLAEERFIGFPRPSAPAAYDMIHSRLRAAGIFPRIVHEADSLLARLRLVGAGIGIALVSGTYAADLPRPGVVLRPLRPPRLTAAIGMVHYAPRRTAALEHFLAVARETAPTRAAAARSRSPRLAPS